MKTATIVSTVTALLMVVLGLFWMFVWLVGSNGLNSSKGGYVLCANFVIVVASILASTLGSGWLVRKWSASGSMPIWIICPLAMALTIGGCLVVMTIASLVIAGGI